jgi:hypothetical protein
MTPGLLPFPSHLTSNGLLLSSAFDTAQSPAEKKKKVKAIEPPRELVKKNGENFYAVRIAGEKKRSTRRA